MLQKDFRYLFLENILNFLWRQWSALGVLGEARTEDPWVIDPEPMLLFTLEMGRFEPRLFDEVLDWLVVNGKRIPPSPELGVFFLSCGFNRPEVKIRRLTREVPVTSQRTIRFLLRALFGVGSRAECLVYLLTNDGGHPSEVARAIGLSVRGTQDALIDLSRSGLVLTRQTGKRKIEYWLSHERWWEFLSKGSITEFKKPIWLDWISLFSALSNVWNALNEMREEGISDYLRSSRIRDSMETIGSEFLKSGLDIPPIPGKNVRPEEYEKAFEAFI